MHETLPCPVVLLRQMQHAKSPATLLLNYKFEPVTRQPRLEVSAVDFHIVSGGTSSRLGRKSPRCMQTISQRRLCVRLSAFWSLPLRSCDVA